VSVTNVAERGGGVRTTLALRKDSQMDAPDEPWMIEHFSQANPEGAGQDDVPALLRRVAAPPAPLRVGRRS
jgi:hypothetical protein